MCRKVLCVKRLNSFVLYYFGIIAIYIPLFILVSVLWKAARGKDK